MKSKFYIIIPCYKATGKVGAVVKAIESIADKKKHNIDANSLEGHRSQPISSLTDSPIERISSGYQELDRVLGGGLVPGSLVLIGGDPGIGKSTAGSIISSAFDYNEDI